MNKDKLRDKIIGMFLGVAIGDALGMPLEFLKEEERAKLGRVEEYIKPPASHQWWHWREPGTWTDDWYFTDIVAESLLACDGINIDDLARRHAQAYCSGLKEIGAGGATREALKNLAEGQHWSKSGIAGGAGNGVAMKVAPLGVLHYLNMNFYGHAVPTAEEVARAEGSRINQLHIDVINLALMTHSSHMSAASAIAQINAIACCLFDYPKEAVLEFCFWDMVIKACAMSEITTASLLDSKVHDKLSERFTWFMNGVYQQLSAVEISRMQGKDKGYVFYTLPFCYSVFLKNPTSVDTLYDVVNAGGDSDTNGSIVGSLLGAYNGRRIFPKHLVDGLHQSDEILDLAERFYRQFVK